MAGPKAHDVELAVPQLVRRMRAFLGMRIEQAWLLSCMQGFMYCRGMAVVGALSRGGCITVP